MKSYRVKRVIGATLDSVIRVDTLNVLPMASVVRVWLELGVPSLVWKSRRFNLAPRMKMRLVL